MSGVEIRTEPGWWANLIRVVCDSCGWRGPVRDIYRDRERTLARVERSTHRCSEVDR